MFTVALLAPVGSFAAGQVKLLHATAIYQDGKDGPFREPEALACNDRTLVVVDTGNGRLVRMNWQDGVSAEVQEIRHERLPFPIKAAITPDGEILALDGKLRTLARFNPAGEYLGEFTAKGETGMVVRSLRIDGQGNVYLLDIHKGRVLKLGADGQVAAALPFPAGYSYIVDLAISFNGDILLLDSSARKVYASRQGAAFALLASGLGDYMDFPAGIETDPQGLIYLVDYSGGSIASIDPEGNFLGRHLAMGWKEGLLHYPTQLCFNGKGQAFIADRNNNRIQVFNVVTN
jgi:sugar lactone lactonase YvrE